MDVHMQMTARNEQRNRVVNNKGTFFTAQYCFLLFVCLFKMTCSFSSFLYRPPRFDSNEHQEGGSRRSELISKNRACDVITSVLQRVVMVIACMTSTTKTGKVNLIEVELNRNVIVMLFLIALMTSLMVNEVNQGDMVEVVVVEGATDLIDVSSVILLLSNVC